MKVKVVVAFLLFITSFTSTSSHMEDGTSVSLKVSCGWVSSFDQWRWEEVTCDTCRGKHLISDTIPEAAISQKLWQQQFIWRKQRWNQPECRANRWRTVVLKIHLETLQTWPEWNTVLKHFFVTAAWLSLC